MLIVWTGLGPIMVLRNRFVGISTVEIKVMRWYHHCFTFDFKTMKYKMYLDGKIVAQGVTNQPLDKLKGN